MKWVVLRVLLMVPVSPIQDDLLDHNLLRSPHDSPTHHKKEIRTRSPKCKSL